MNKYLSLVLISTSIALFGAQNTAGTCSHCGKGLSSAFVDVVKKCRSSVVYIETKYKMAERDRHVESIDQFQDEIFRRFFGAPGGGNERVERKPVIGSGTGFIVSEDGYIVTNHHVVKDASEILVEIYQDDSETEYQAVLVGCDPKTDIAVLKIEEKGLPFLTFANSDELEPGQWIVAIGHPLRLRDSVTAGVISAKHRTNLQITQLEDYVQTDASLNPGSSGSPLLDLEGRVVAVNTAIIPPSSKNMGVGFSVPSKIAEMVYEHVKSTGVVNRGFLGVNIQDLTEDLVEGFGFKKGTKGALISSVAKNSAGELAGLVPGDLITAFNGKKIKSSCNFATEVGKLPAGKKCELEVVRKGEKIKLEAMLGSLVSESAANDDAIVRLGVVVESIAESAREKYQLKNGETGLLIKDIVPGSLAHRSGWKAGSVILVVNGDKIATVEDLKKAIEKTEKGKKLVALLSRDGQSLFTSITVS